MTDYTSWIIQRGNPSFLGLIERIPLCDPGLLGFEERVGGIEDFDFHDLVLLRDRVDDILAFGDFAEDGMLAVEVGSRQMGDEKLAAVRAGAGIGHRENPGLVVLEAGFDLVLELVAGTAHAGAGRVAALDHEIRDHPVKREAVVVAVLREVEVVGNGDGSFRGEQCGFDISLVGFNNDADVIHGVCLRCGDRGKCQTQMKK